MNNLIVYLLINTSNKYTYLGITNNSAKRIRAHNGEIKGGARYTKLRKGKGVWRYYLKVENLSKQESLSIERTAKNLRKKATGKTNIQKRLSVLLPILEKYPHCQIIYL